MEVNALILGLGSNLGDRLLHLQNARKAIQAQLGSVEYSSPIYETQPIDMESDHWFFNACLFVETQFLPKKCLKITQEIEKELGREKKSSQGNHPDRIIDIDLLFFNNSVINTEELTLPHPHWSERDFVLAPLNDLINWLSINRKDFNDSRSFQQNSLVKPEMEVIKKYLMW